MHQALKAMPLAGALLLGGVLTSGLLAFAEAQDEPKPARTARGGALARAGSSQIEVFFYPTGLRAFPMDSAGTPIDASKLTGTATFYHPNSPRPWFSRPLHSSPAVAGQTSPSLDLVIGLGSVPADGSKVAFVVAGLPVSAEFTVPFVLTKTPTESSETHPAPPPGVVTASPRYVYGPGYSGVGYYQYPGPEAAPAPSSNPTVYSYGTPGGRSGSSSRSTHDWSTGRDFQSGGLISKPWLSPRD